LIRETARGIELEVRVIPRARRSEIAGIRSNALLIKLAAPPVEGAANEALIACLAQKFDLPRQSIRILSGERSRHKRVEVAGVSAAIARQRLAL